MSANEKTYGAVLRIDAGSPGAAVDPMFYGTYFEEYNHNTNGGLYAEKVMNRSFEDRRNPMDGWSVRSGSDARVVAKVVTENSLNPYNPHSLRLDILEPAGGVGLVNTGYRGIGIQKGEGYLVSFYALSLYDDYGEVALRFEAPSGTALSAPASVCVTGRAWKRYQVRLEAEESDGKAQLVLFFTAAGTLWIDFVSVFPEKTWRGRKNGLRDDLAQMRYEQGFGHMKWPGGCPIHMGTEDELCRPLGSLRPIEERHNYVAHYNGNWSDDGLGFHEYLQFSEDMGATPVFAVFSGVFCNVMSYPPVPLEHMEPYIQEAVHAIDYANEPATGEYGLLRAGLFAHPEPFHLHYLEIGNEDYAADDEQGAYPKRWAMFYRAVKEKHPDVQLIANARGNDDLGTELSPEPDLLDVHYYKDQTWLFQHHRIFDGYDRRKPKLLIGELDNLNPHDTYMMPADADPNVELSHYALFANRYHVYSPPKFSNAIALAAFITGCERNADVVKMISCFGGGTSNVDYESKWESGDVYLNTLACYGTPHYYMAKMFATNRADTVLPVTALSWETDSEEPSTGFPDNSIDRMYTSAGRDTARGDIVLKVVNAGSVPRDTVITVDGAVRLNPKGDAQVMAADLQAYNDFDDPTRVIPVRTCVDVPGTTFHHCFAAHSITVLRLHLIQSV